MYGLKSGHYAADRPVASTLKCLFVSGTYQRNPSRRRRQSNAQFPQTVFARRISAAKESVDFLGVNPAHDATWLAAGLIAALGRFAAGAAQRTRRIRTLRAPLDIHVIPQPAASAVESTRSTVAKLALALTSIGRLFEIPRTHGDRAGHIPGRRALIERRPGGPPRNQRGTPPASDVPGPTRRASCLPLLHRAATRSLRRKSARRTSPCEADLLFFVTIHDVCPGPLPQFLHSHRSESDLGAFSVG